MMDKRQFLDFLSTGDFASLFNEAGWNRPASNRPFVCEIGAEKKRFVFREVAELFVRVFVCETDALPLTAERNALDARLRKLGDAYVAIFVQEGPQSPAAAMHHLWMVPVKSADRRTLVRVEYKGRDQAEFLFGKMQDLQFPIGSPPGSVDVLDRLNRVFQVNSADVTKKFYREFRLQHNTFVKGIRGIVDKSDCEWYASVMLNRLMFCYFIQKKGFLDLDTDYLSHKLAQVRERKGEDKFYGTFYKAFLRVLFAEGLNSRTRSKAFERKFGRIPYLNGGMFEVHVLEAKYPGIDILDAVFEELFAFFDQWRWHLDTSLTATGRDINPDVLGYIFEQYINDRAQMGAYYTKEDITEYIARNTLVPWLFNETAKKSPAAFKPNGFVWEFLKAGSTGLNHNPDNPANPVQKEQWCDRYIFPAVRKGVDLPLPPEIGKGVAVEPQNSLRARRADWNKPADEAFALPTEIWRETVARRQRCQELRAKISSGTIADINDFITCNLDIRKFAEDLLAQTTDHLFVRHFFDALCRVTVLDPTCGSGAFLFAALGILEPLYEICLTRMQDDWPDKFKDELSALRTKYRGNLKYCIYKNIILRNLYGVDIMREATEIARLRLFLKMVAVVDVDEMADNLGLDPLPDIDFNIRCGNTLVGFANPQGVKDAILPPDELGLDTEAYKKVEDKAADISDLYERFKALQQTAEGSSEFYDAKKKLNAKLLALNGELDRAMAHRQYGIDADTLRGHREFEDWKRRTQPFHWYSEFYGIAVANGGFDVIIGNPPYLELSKVNEYELKDFKTLKCNNLYACVLERVQSLRALQSRLGMIVPISISSAGAYQPLRECIITEKCVTCFAHFSNRPGQLFEGAQNRLSILLAYPTSGKPCVLASKYLHWDAKNGERLALFQTLEYCKTRTIDGLVCKSGHSTPSAIIDKVISKSPLSLEISSVGTHSVYWVRVPGYFCQFLRRELMAHTKSGKPQPRGEMLSMQFDSERLANVVFAVLNSSLFYMYFSALTDTRHINPSDARSFPVGIREMDSDISASLLLIAKRLVKNYEANLGYVNKSALKIESLNSPVAKPIIDEIDEMLAKHYGFTEEELDFIINYDIKYRMGDKLGGGEE